MTNHTPALTPRQEWLATLSDDPKAKRHSDLTLEMAEKCRLRLVQEHAASIGVE